MNTVYQNVVARIRAEYLEMPGMRLTAPQVQRLCGVDAPSCLRALNALVNDQFLCLKPNGTYARVAEEAMSRMRPAKAHLLRSRLRAVVRR